MNKTEFFFSFQSYFKVLFFRCAIIISYLFCLPHLSLALENDQNIALDVEPIHWYEGKVKKLAWVSLDEIALFHNKKTDINSNKKAEINKAIAAISGSGFVIENKKIQKNGKSFTIIPISKILSKRNLSEQINFSMTKNPETTIAPVLYVDTDKKESSRITFDNEIIVQFNETLNAFDIDKIEEQFALQKIKTVTFSPNTFIYKTNKKGLEIIDVANSLYHSGLVAYAYPNLHRKKQKKQTIPNDPLFNDQWHLRNTGQSGGTAGNDVAIINVWDKYQASSEQVIAIVDDGLDILHEDLSPNLISDLSWDFVDDDNNPSPEEGDSHGTACAGVAIGRGGNGIGISGAAPKAGLVGFRLTHGAISDLNVAEALVKHNGVVDIYSNSWGAPDDNRLEGFGPLALDALLSGVSNGRDNLGNIYVFAGGNGKADNENSNADGHVNSRYVIAVAASTDSGMQSYYSEPGANILVTAPSDGGKTGITTTDITGTAGYNAAANGNYNSDFGGTSSATPLVSGIIALILEANPLLNWRDFRYILAKSSDKIDSGDAGWTTNSAGYEINDKYGFGRINAYRAVQLAENWESAGQELSGEAETSPNVSIPDEDLTGISSTVTINEDFKVEFAEIYFSANDHTFWPDLKITLTSPQGTESLLSTNATEITNSANNYDNWRFGSVRHFMESSKGDWTLSVKDIQEGDTGTLQHWRLVLYGTIEPGHAGNQNRFPALPAVLLLL